MLRAAKRWLIVKDTGGLKDFWGHFLDGCGPCIQWAIKEAAEEARRNDPVLKAAQEKRQREFEDEVGGALGTTINKRPDEGPVVTDLHDLD